jgi:hypothetical protein
MRNLEGKFPDSFMDFWKAEGTRVLLIPPRAPKANAYIESILALAAGDEF